MPAIGQGSGKSAAAERRTRRRRRSGSRPETAGNPRVSGTYRAPRPQRTSAFGAPQRADAPITRASGQAAERGARARQRMPGRVRAPHVPIIENPTPQQTAAARKLITQTITRAVGSGGSGAERLQRRRQVERDLMRDPRLRRAVEHYSRAGRAQTAVRWADALGLSGGEVPYGNPQLLQLARNRQAVAGDRAVAGRDARDRVRPGTPKGLAARGLATILGATSLQGAAAENTLVKRALADVGALATGPFVGGVELAKSLESDLVHGRTVLSDESQVRHLGEGIAKSTAHEVAHPGESFTQHPLLTLLDLAGAAGIAGKGAGALARGAGSKAGAGGLRGALAEAGSTVRAPLAAIDDAGAVRQGTGLVERRHSKDIIRKAGEVLQDSIRSPVRDAEGNVVTVTQRGREVPVLRMTSVERAHHHRRNADFDASRTNSVERMVRDEAARDFHVAGRVAGRLNRQLEQRGVKGRTARDLVSMVVEGTITSAKHFDADLEAEAGRIRGFLQEHEDAVAAGRRGESPFRHSGELRAARARLAVIEKAQHDPRVRAQVERIVATGEDVGRRLNEQEREAVRMGLLTPARAARSKRVPVAVAHLGGQHFTAEDLAAIGHKAPSDGQLSLLPEDVVLTEAELRHGGIRKPDGTFLSNREIDAFLKERGRDPESVAYLPHRLDVRGRRAFHTQFRPGTRGSMEKGETRTGSAYAKGVTESSARLIQEQGVRQVTQIAKAKQLDRMVQDRGLRRPDGRYFTATEGRELAQRLEADTGERWVPIRAFAAKLDEQTQRIIREGLQGPAGMEDLPRRLLSDRIVLADDAAGAARARNVVLVPAQYVDQLHRHLRPAGSLQKFFQMLNRPFRFAVLAQPRWLVGNFVEPFLVRLTTVGSGINVFGLGVDVAAATRGLRRAERSGNPAIRAAAKELRGQQLAGLFVGGRGASVRRTPGEISAVDTAYGALVSKLPVVAQGVDLVRLVGHALMAPGGGYFRLNHAIENVANKASLGRNVRRDLQEMHGWVGSWKAVLGLQEKALDEAMAGAVNTSTQRRWMKDTEELLGKYAGFPPWVRELVQGAMPFLPWALNAARFTLWTMPAHRTTQTALLLKVNDVVSKDWEEVHKDVPPGGLRLALPTAKGGWVDLARYTPYGLTGPIAEGMSDPGTASQGIVDQVTPQLSGLLEALQGRDPFGRDLQVDPRENGGDSSVDFPKALGQALYSALESYAPYLGQIRRVREGGGTAYAGSTVLDPDVKPGSDHMSGLRRTFDPFRPTYLHAPRGSSAPAPRRRGPKTQQDRINEALSRTRGASLSGTQQQRIQAALEKLAGGG